MGSLGKGLVWIFFGCERIKKECPKSICDHRLALPAGISWWLVSEKSEALWDSMHSFLCMWQGLVQLEGGVPSPDFFS